MTDTRDGRTAAERVIGFGKDLVVLLRDAALLVLAGLLLLFPQHFNGLLVRAGFEEGSIAGFKWKAKLVEADDSLKDARATIATLQAQLDKAANALHEAQSSVGDQSLKSELGQIHDESRRVTAASAAVEAAVQSTIADQATLVEKAQTAVAPNGDWGVVFGSDVSLPAAQDEIKRAARNGLPGAAVYFRNGYFASIAVAGSRSAAQGSLAAARQFRQDAYIASMSSWCRSPAQRDGFIECRTRP